VQCNIAGYFPKFEVPWHWQFCQNSMILKQWPQFECCVDNQYARAFDELLRMYMIQFDGLANMGHCFDGFM
jgi:hypothetical protein